MPGALLGAGVGPGSDPRLDQLDQDALSLAILKCYVRTTDETLSRFDFNQVRSIVCLFSVSTRAYTCKHRMHARWPPYVAVI